MTTAPLDPQWYIARDGKRFGPIPDAEFRQMSAEGRVRELDYVWKQGFGDWVLAKNVPGLLKKPTSSQPSIETTLEPSPAPTHAETIEPFDDNPLGAQDRPATAFDHQSNDPRPSDTNVISQHMDGSSSFDQGFGHDISASQQKQRGYAPDPIALQRSIAQQYARQEPQFDQGISQPQPYADSNQQPLGSQTPRRQSSHRQILPERQETFANPDFRQSTFDQINNQFANQGYAENQFQVDQYESDGYHIDGIPHQSFPDNPELAAELSATDTNRGGGILRKFAYMVALLLFIGVMAVVAVPFVIPADAIRDQIVRLIEKQTGRNVDVRGRTSVAFFPTFGVRLNDVTLSNPPGVAGEPLLRMAALQVDLKLLPLLQQQVELESFILQNPRLSLYVDQTGQHNWRLKPATSAPGQFGSINQHPSNEYATTEHRLIPTVGTTVEPPTSENAIATSRVALNNNQASRSYFEDLFVIKDVSLGDVRIVEGSIAYQDVRSGSQHQVDAISLVVGMKKLSEPLTVNGTAKWRGEALNISADVATPSALFNQGFSPLKLSVNSAPLNANFRGQMTNGDSTVFIGNLSGEASSLNALMKMAGAKTLLKGGNDKVAFTTELAANAEKINLEKTSVRHASTSASGKTQITLNGPRPYIRSVLTVDHLNLNRFMPVTQSPNQVTQATVPQNPTPAVSQPPAPSMQPGPMVQQDDADQPQSLTDLINSVSDGEHVITTHTPNNAPIGQPPAINRQPSPFAGLTVADADITLKANKVTYQKIVLGQTDGLIKVKDGKVLAKVEKAELYGGTATADLSMNAAEPGGFFKSTLNAENVSALPFLRDAADFDWVSGTANIKAEITGIGERHEEVMKSLSGTSSIAFTEGSIEGVNIPGMIRNAQNGNLSGLSRSDGEKTDFSELTGTFRIEQGVATNKDLKLVSPLLRIAGNGRINLAEETVDYQLQPKIVASLKGQGGKKKDQLAGIEIPVRVTGPWVNPQILPDTGKLLENPEAIVKGVEQIGKILKKKNIKTKDFESIINNVLKPASAPNEAVTTPTQKPKPQQNDKQLQAIETNKLLKQLLAQ